MLVMLYNISCQRGQESLRQEGETTMKMTAKTTAALPAVAEALRTARRLFTYDGIRKAQSLPTVETLRKHNLVEEETLYWGYSEGEENTIVGGIAYVGIKWKGEKG